MPSGCGHRQPLSCWSGCGRPQPPNCRRVDESGLDWARQRGRGQSAPPIERCSARALEARRVVPMLAGLIVVCMRTSGVWGTCVRWYPLIGARRLSAARSSFCATALVGCDCTDTSPSPSPILEGAYLRHRCRSGSLPAPKGQHRNEICPLRPRDRRAGIPDFRRPRTLPAAVLPSAAGRSVWTSAS